MDAQHTPKRDFELRAIDLEALGVSVAFIITDSEERKQAAKRNARLVANADEVIQALKSAVSIIGHPEDAMTKYFNDLIARVEGAAA